MCSECGRPPTTTYIICTTPRSGSWLLSEGLESTGLGGRPREWFNTLEENRHGPMRWDSYLKLACSLSHSANGVSGVKVHHYQVAEVLRPRGVPLQALFPQAKYIWLLRRDKEAQATSFLRARATGKWHSTGSEKVRVPTADPDALARARVFFIRGDQYWNRFFISNSIKPHIIHYEDDLAELDDYRRTIRTTLDFIGVPDAYSVEVPPPRLQRQS